MLNEIPTLFEKAVFYLDPGSGSLLIQLLLAALLGAGIFIRAQWEKIKGLFGIKSNKQDDAQDDEDAE